MEKASITRFFKELTISAKHLSYLGIIVVIFLLVSISSFATSVYTIGHGTGPFPTGCPLNAFDVVNDQIVFRGSVKLPVHGYGGIAVAFDELTSTIFVSFEKGDYGGGNAIEIVDAKTLQNIGLTVDENAVKDLTGIVFDSVKRVLYGTDRDSNKLHIISWNPARKKLSLEKTVKLENIDYACGLAIDGDLLYVSEFNYEGKSYYSDVNCYRISQDFAFVKTVDMGDMTVAIAHESVGNNLYGGAYAWTAYQHLIKNNMDDPNDLIKKTIGAGVIGVACDQETTGRVFLTTFRNGGSVEMWDTADWVAEPNTLTALDATYIFDDPNQDVADVRNLSGILVANTPKPPYVQIVKRDNVETCVSPTAADPNFVYTIGISDPNGHENLWIVDYLPREVDFVSASPADPNFGYDLETHTYRWFVSSIDAYDPNDPNSIPGGDPNEYFTLTVQPNGWAEPMSSFTNTATVESDAAYSWASTETDVCCWGGNVIYVDQQAIEDSGYIEFMGLESTWATGRNTGTSWEDAYHNLADALARAADCGSEIWVAQGTYHPSDTVLTDTFEIPAGVSVYGGFAGNETSRDQRNFLKNKTILSGFIGLEPDGMGGTNEVLSDVVVTMKGNGALLDGFTVEQSGEKGVDGSGFSSTIANCVIMDNEQTGVYCENSDLNIQWCEIKENGQRGIWHRGNSYSLTVGNCKICNNQWDGILTEYSTSTILNSLLYQNGLEVSPYKYYGINLVNPSNTPHNPVIRNDTIVQNVNAGIRFVGSNEPDIVNCIVYYNGGDVPLVGLNPDDVAYNCCIADCNEPQGTTNFNDEPGFAYTTEPNDLPVVGNYHLAYDSPCVNTGDSDEYADEFDIDGEPRVYGTLVDIGADEAYSCDDEYLTENDIWNSLDFNADGIVNFSEYAIFAAAWLSYSPAQYSDPNLTDNWNAICNFDDTGDSQYVIDLDDFGVFSDNWLWSACWRTDLQSMAAQQSASSSMMSALTLESSLLAQSLQTAPAQSVYEPTPTAQAESIVQILDFLDGVLEEETVENESGILEIKAVLEDWLEELDLQ